MNFIERAKRRRDFLQVRIILTRSDQRPRRAVSVGDLRTAQGRDGIERGNSFERLVHGIDGDYGPASSVNAQWSAAQGVNPFDDDEAAAVVGVDRNRLLVQHVVDAGDVNAE